MGKPKLPKVTARELKVIKTPVDTEYNIFGIENVEAIKGYQETEYGRSFDAKISVNGGEWFNEYFNFMEGTPNQAVITNLQGAIGDNVRVMLEVDPEKTEYDPTPCILEATVVALAPTLTNARSPECDDMVVNMNEDVILTGTNLNGFERLVAHHEECADPIELPTEGVYAEADGTELDLPGSIWVAIKAKVDPGVMPTRPITFEVITPGGSASISPTVP